MDVCVWDFLIFNCFKEYSVLLLLAMEGWNKTRRSFSQALLFFTKWSWHSLFSCILKDCQDELRYTNMSVLDYERRASVQPKSSKKVLLLFNQELPISGFTFYIPPVIYWNWKKHLNQIKPNLTKLKKPRKNPRKNTQTKQNQSPQKPLPRGVKVAVSIAILVAKNRRQSALLMPTV